ncbi:MAG TPA: type II toxin-antitoxin system RelE/ParE family toxin [Chitinophagaceae bacterium]|jgi:plasmid stabilization system protein ParE|nr:type II toxin-antitoxin system RelE/ParE family toxin [Chitinophagaceae bacterium]HMU59619.1 type II toxin-antitoxin system RelE/ParE family toxin [Chitinophagaceae bacterium]
MQKNNFSISISPGAADEIIETAAWYNNKVEGLGERFLKKLKSSLEEIQQSPFAFAKINQKGNIRRKITAGFPYKIFYLLDETHIEVLAVIHFSRSNRFIKRRLK